MGIKPIGLSFKSTPEDTELYKWIVKHSNKSGFIKDILKAAKESEVSKDEQTKTDNMPISMIDMNF